MNLGEALDVFRSVGHSSFGCVSPASCGAKMPVGWPGRMSCLKLFLPWRSNVLLRVAPHRFQLADLTAVQSSAKVKYRGQSDADKAERSRSGKRCSSVLHEDPRCLKGVTASTNAFEKLLAASFGPMTVSLAVPRKLSPFHGLESHSRQPFRSCPSPVKALKQVPKVPRTPCVRHS